MQCNVQYATQPALHGIQTGQRPASGVSKDLDPEIFSGVGEDQIKAKVRVNIGLTFSRNMKPNES